MAVKRSAREQRLQKILQRAAAAKNSGLHGADTALEDFRNFLVAETFEVAQNHRGAKNVRNLLQGAAHSHLNFHGGKLLEWEIGKASCRERGRGRWVGGW